MNRKFLFSLIFVFISVRFINAQEPSYLNYKWDQNPGLHKLSREDMELPELVIKEFHMIEFTTKNEDDQVSYHLVHKIIRVNSDKSIKRNNRLYLPLSDNAKLLVNKARVINPNGQIKELKDSDIKEGVDEDTKATYRYFALDGIDLGSEIEYLNVIEKDPEYFGQYYFLQNDIDKRNVEFEIIQPKHLVFKSKSYNGFPELKDSTLANGLKALYAKADIISALKEEPFATYKPHLMQLIYKLDENKTKGKKGIVNYVSASQNVYDYIHETIDKPVAKKLQKLTNQINVEKISDITEKIRAIENYLKTNYFVMENSRNVSLSSILEFKNTNQNGMIKLFCAVLEQLKVDYELVITSDRFVLKFDPKFEAYPFLDTYLLYFPGINKYLCPSSRTDRLDCVPYGYINNYGLFIKSVSLGDFKSGVGEVKFIEPNKSDQTIHDHYITVDFSKSMDNPEILYKILFTGYYAHSIQPYYSYMPEDRQVEMNNSILKNILKNASFSDIVVENKGADLLGSKPLIIKAKCTNANIVEQAGEKYLFKIGELIGPQSELYQEKERKLEVENDFNRSYTREITFVIPDGYKVNNLDALKFNVLLLENNEPTSSFVSNYEVQGNKVTVKVKENYNQIAYPLSRFEEYRRVINAAADFNKVTLIIEKK